MKQIFIKKKAVFLCLLTAICLGAKNDTEFGDQLLRDGSFSSAVYTYERALFNETDSVKKEALTFKLAQAYYKNKNFKRSSDLLNSLVENAHPAIQRQAQWELAKEYLQEGWFDFAALEFKDYASTYNDETAHYLAGWSYLKDNNYDKAALTFQSLTAERPSSNYGLAAQKLSAAALKGKTLPQKSPKAAQVMSMILPGSGQIYAGSWQDGVVSFLLNALTISLFSNALQENRTGEALIWLSLETAWYFGGAYSGYNSAHKYNERQHRVYLENLEYEYQPEKILE